MIDDRIGTLAGLVNTRVEGMLAVPQVDPHTDRPRRSLHGEVGLVGMAKSVGFASGPVVGRVHDRMPMAITDDNWQAWLDPGLTEAETALGLMAPPETGSLEIYPVSKDVNNVKTNGPELLEPIPAE